MSLSEKQLIIKAKAKDKEAFRELVQMHQARAYSLALYLMKNTEDAKDLVQESFVKAYLNIDKFKGESKFFTWLYRIIYNMSIDLKRSRKNNFEYKEADNVQEVQTPENFMQAQESLVGIKNSLAQLSNEHRIILELKEIDGLSYQEIAKSLNLSIGTVMSRLFYARKKLQALLSDKETKYGIK